MGNVQRSHHPRFHQLGLLSLPWRTFLQMHPRVLAKQADLLCDFLSVSLEGEKDPRCLLVAFDAMYAPTYPTMLPPYLLRHAPPTVGRTPLVSAHQKPWMVATNMY